MTGLNKEEAEAFLKECEEQYDLDTQFLLDNGWTKKEGEHVVWISPKGEEFSHDWGFFGDHTRAINKAKHDIVLDSGFIQFQVQVFNDEDEPKNYKGSEEPYDWFFPCIKDSKIYWYDEAVSLACYGIETNYENDRWLALKDLLLREFDLNSIKHKEIIEVVELYDFDTKVYEFRKRAN